MRGPFFDAVANEIELVVDEEELTSTEDEEPEVEITTGEGEADAVAEPVANNLDEEAIMGMKVTELRDQLKARNLKKSGNKLVLQRRLKAAVLANVPLVTAEELIGNTADPELFAVGARWELLDAGDTIDEEGLLEVEGQVYLEPTVARRGTWEVEGIEKVKKKL